MKITKSQLKQIIKEELESVLKEHRGEGPHLHGAAGHLKGKGPADDIDLRWWRGDEGRAWDEARRLDPDDADVETAYAKRSFSKDLDAVEGLTWAQGQQYSPLHRGIGLVELAKELALQAGLEDEATYDWKDFMDEAKREIMRLGVNFGR